MLSEDLICTVNPAKSLYDPVNKAEETARIVTKGDFRKYCRFRSARFYGGIGTADCIGCCLQCQFCWAWHKVIKPERYGNFFSPRQVADKLTNVAYKKGFRQVRISGNEPTLSRDHLLKVMELLVRDILFILEPLIRISRKSRWKSLSFMAMWKNACKRPEWIMTTPAGRNASPRNKSRTEKSNCKLALSGARG